jgi:hypothetical protein
VRHLRSSTLRIAVPMIGIGLGALLALTGPPTPGPGGLSPSTSPRSSVTQASGPPDLETEGPGISIAASAPASTPSQQPAATPRPTTSATRAPTPAPTAVPKPAVTPAPVAACPVFLSSNAWNRDVSSLPVAADSQTLIGSIGLDASLHPDFSATGYGIPINLVGPSTPLAPVTFGYADESDPGPYPVPAAPLIEGGSDRHVLLWDTTGCRLYELYAAARGGSGSTAGSGAIWDLRSNALRPDGWTSADAAGLPILPGLVRYEEVARGAILHAIRFTAPHTRTAHIFPARHDAGESSSSALPPMGLRIRLKASVDVSSFGPQARVILAALKQYGMLLADNGSPWYITGAPDPRWDDDELHALHQLTGDDFEVVDTSSL